MLKKILIVIISCILIIIFAVIIAVSLGLIDNDKPKLSNFLIVEKSLKKLVNFEEETTQKETAEESSETVTSNETIDIYKDDNYVVPKGLEKLADFICYRGIIGPNNMLDDKEIRIQYIQYLLMSEKMVNNSSSKDGQSFPYVKESVFKNKYNDELDTTKYNYENDKDSNHFFDCNNHEETKNKDYKCWNGTWGVYGNNIYFYEKNRNESNNIYTISGNYKRTTKESGTFEIKYIIRNDKKYLSSIIVNNN